MSFLFRDTSSSRVRPRPPRRSLAVEELGARLMLSSTTGDPIPGVPTDDMDPPMPGDPIPGVPTDDMDPIA